jgi:hypothetical protein
MPMPTGGEVEHGEGFAAEFLAHARDDDVGRGADKGDDAAEQRGEGHRHQEDRGRLPVLAGELIGDRQHHRERADVLDDRRHGGDDEDEHGDLRLRRAQGRGDTRQRGSRPVPNVPPQH